MLDVSIRAGILNLMVDLREKESVSILYITHDIASAAMWPTDHRHVRRHVVETGPPKRFWPAQSIHTPSCCSRPCQTRMTDLGLGIAHHRRAPRVVNPTGRLPFPLALPLCHRRMLADNATATSPGPAHSGACHVATADSLDAVDSRPARRPFGVARRSRLRRYCCSGREFATQHLRKESA